MTDSKDKNSLYRGPSPKHEDARTRARRDTERSTYATRNMEQDKSRVSRVHNDHTARQTSVSVTHEHGSEKIKECRIYGLNACLAAFKKRPDSIRKLWLLESRIPKLTALLAFCVKNKIGYNVVENEDLEKLTVSAHHEGVCLALLPQQEPALSTWLMTVATGPCLMIWLDGVGNPHNLGAIMRSAAHFGVNAILLPKQSSLTNSGAAARVAEGAAEYVPLVRLGRSENAIEQLQAAGFELITTVVRGGSNVFKTDWPRRCVLVMGAEQAGVEAELLAASKHRLEIPGTGYVDSLNVSAATAVLLAEWRRRIA
jgi:TrmH RNA methyltransferase